MLLFANDISIISSSFISLEGFATFPFITTLPLSQASFATVLLFISSCIVYWKVSTEWKKYFTEEEILASKGELKLAPQFCDECEEKLNKKKNNE